MGKGVIISSLTEKTIEYLCYPMADWFHSPVLLVLCLPPAGPEAASWAPGPSDHCSVCNAFGRTTMGACGWMVFSLFRSDKADSLFRIRNGRIPPVFQDESGKRYSG